MIGKVDRFFIFAGVLPFKPNVYFLNHFNFQIVTFCLSPKFADSKTNMKRKRNIFAKYTEITLIAPKTYKHKYLAPILRDIFSQYLGRKKKSFRKIFETSSQIVKAPLQLFILGGHLKVYYIGEVGLLNPFKSPNSTTITTILQDRYRISNTYRTEQKMNKLDKYCFP